jgi:uncharacterized membrane protein YphA (DoxX/SURF4 family)
MQRKSWTGWVGLAAAVAMAILWFTAGLWKLSDISGWQLKLTQLLVPVNLSLVGTLAVGIAEVTAGVLLLRPAWRRWGGWLSSALLVGFMVYMAVNYQTLQGEDCSCFPWLERAVGPAFFWSDAAMLAASLLAVRFSSPPTDIRRAGIALAGVAAFAAIMLGADSLEPESDLATAGPITVDGVPYDLEGGRIFLFFFNPSCIHCLHAGQTMAKYTWRVDFVGVPTQDPDWAPGFVEDAGLSDVRLSPDIETLRETFEFQDVPFGALLEDGTVLDRLIFWEEPALSDTLRLHGFID